MVCRALLFASLVGNVAAAPGNMPLVRLTEEQYAAKGAVCLDGGAPGFYYKSGDASLSSDPEAATSWVLYFKGGGWCYNEKDCLKRAGTSKGNSSQFPATFGFGGFLDESPKVSPIFAGFNHVVLWYCDGASFSGDREDPHVDEKTGTKVYFRGRRVLDAILDVLLDSKGPYGLNQATQVVVAGGSAGGLSTFLHADYIGTRMPATVNKFRAVPLSGFFLLHEPFSTGTSYVDSMKYVFNMQNSSSGVHPDCLAAGHDWRCIFANYSYAHSSTPFFPLQSGLDSWQMGNVFRFPGQCAKKQFQVCTTDEIKALNDYSHSLVQDFQRTDKYNRAGEGGFIESCLEHVAGQGSNFDSYEIAGVRMVDAVNTWWTSSDAPASWSLPCDLSTSTPHQCNPTCGTKLGGCMNDDCESISEDVALV